MHPKRGGFYNFVNRTSGVLLLIAFFPGLMSLVVQTLPLLIQLVQVGVLFNSSPVSPHALFLSLFLRKRPGTVATAASRALLGPTQPPHEVCCKTDKEERRVTSCFADRLLCTFTHFQPPTLIAAETCTCVITNETEHLAVPVKNLKCKQISVG